MAANEPTRETPTARCDYWLAQASEAITKAEAARDSGDRELSHCLADLAQACSNLACHYLNLARV